MEYSGFSQKKWKYLSFALMGVIATGMLAPTAFAASPTLGDVLNTVLGIKTTTDRLPGQLQTIKCNSGIRPHVDLTNCSLTFMNLRDADIKFIRLDGAGLQQSDLANANLYISSLVGANFDSANLSNANLRYSIAIGAIFARANLSGADLRNTNLINVNFYGANLDGANLTDADITGVNFTFCTGTPIGITPNPCTP